MVPFLISVRLFNLLNRIVFPLVTQYIHEIRRAALHIQHEPIHAAYQIIVSHKRRDRDHESENRR